MSRPIEPHEVSESVRLWELKEKKKREDEIRAPVEKKLAEAEKVLWNARSLVDWVLDDVHVSIGARTLAEELDGILPARKADEAERWLERAHVLARVVAHDRRRGRSTAFHESEPAATKPGQGADAYEPSGQTMAALGWVPEKGELGFEENKEPKVAAPPFHSDERGFSTPPDSEVVGDPGLLRAVNSDDGAIARVAALRASGERARFRVDWTTLEGSRVYRVTIRRADGTIERSPWPLGSYDPPTYQGPEAYSEQDRFVGAKRAAYDGSGSHVVALDPEPEIHPWDRPPTADSKDWRIGKNAMQAPRGDVLFLADLGKLLGTIGVSLVTEMQDGADRAQLLNSFSMEELRAEIERRTIDHLTADSRFRGEPCNHLVADAGLELTPCSRCQRAWCLSAHYPPQERVARESFWVSCDCSRLQPEPAPSVLVAVLSWNARQLSEATAASKESSR